MDASYVHNRDHIGKDYNDSVTESDQEPLIINPEVELSAVISAFEAVCDSKEVELAPHFGLLSFQAKVADILHAN